MDHRVLANRQMIQQLGYWTDKLVFDVGMHDGEDTDYYLSKGYRVVAVDADVRLIERARERFAAAVDGGRLVLLPCAVGEDDGDVEFHLSENTVWNSVKREISGRDQQAVQTVRVPMRRLPTLFQEHGVPLYCKIDVEGMDVACLETLQGATTLPPYISVETECIGDAEQLTESEALRTLEQLQALGYTRFKLVDQTSLVVLSPAESLYRTKPPVHTRLKKRLGLGDDQPYDFDSATREQHRHLEQRLGYAFPLGASGPFGVELDGEWLDAESARKTLLRHRRDYFRMPGAKPYGFWCDWHATLPPNQ